MAEGVRSRKRGLTREAIFACACEMVDEQGLESLSLRSLGRRLDVSQTAVYRHVPDKSALLEGVAERIWREAFADFDAALAVAACADPCDAIALYAHALLTVLRAHPNAVVLVLTHPLSTAGQLSAAAQALERLSAEGIGLSASHFDLVSAVSVYTMGFAAAEVAPPAGGALSEPVANLQDLAGLSDRERMVLAGFASPLREGGWDSSLQFEKGLQALLAGWKAWDRRLGTDSLPLLKRRV